MIRLNYKFKSYKPDKTVLPPLLDTEKELERLRSINEQIIEQEIEKDRLKEVKKKRQRNI